MKQYLLILAVFLALIAVLVVVAYITDRFHIGANLNQQKPVYIPTVQDWGMYQEYLQAVVLCVGNNYSSCGLCRPGDLPQHVAPNGQGIICVNEKIMFAYFFDRKCSLDGGIGNYHYDTTPVEQIVRKLNSVLSNYCIVIGLPPAYVVSARDVGNGRIAVFITI